MFMVSAKPSQYQPRDKKNKLFVISAVPVDIINHFFKKRRGAPGERDPFLGLFDQQAIDEASCRGTGCRRPAIVGGELQRLLDDVAERGAVAAALEQRGPVTASTSQRRCRGPHCE
jgi:hypothetical protein